MSDRDIALRAIQGYIADARDVGDVAMADAKGTATQLVKRRKTAFYCTDGGTAGTNQTETPVFRADVAATIVAVILTFPIAVTANASNLKTFTLAKRTAGGAATNIAVNSTNTSDTVLGSNVVAFKDYSMTVTTANASLASGDVLTFSAIAGGTGVAIAAATSQVWVTVVYEES